MGKPNLPAGLQKLCLEQYPLRHHHQPDHKYIRMGSYLSIQITPQRLLCYYLTNSYKKLNIKSANDTILFILFFANLYIEATIASASASKSPSCSSFTLDLNVTMFSRIFIFFIPSRISFICLPAFGPQEPF